MSQLRRIAFAQVVPGPFSLHKIGNKSSPARVTTKSVKLYATHRGFQREIT